ncbi:two-component system, OmpR family, sensor histidine kinase PhoQ [Halopseudomonas litoralis]|uniref:histidine kinase n=2 Tax=Halopseudomonas litoralis TaxID=797277 RepID=A0A1H1UWU2_9GAMM|nr:two-component system, OmpR family, sensor histidine kinase PhoQ [Halopseudomonas litoralis]
MRSLRSRLVFSAAGFAMLFVLALLPALQNVFDQTLEQVVQQRLAADAATLISVATVVDGKLVMPEHMPDEEFNLPEAKLLGYVHDVAGNLIWHSRSTEDEQLSYLPHFSGNRIDFLRIRDLDQREYYVYDVEVNLAGDDELPLSFITMLPSSEFAPLQKSFSQKLRSWLGGGLLILLVLLWLGLTWSLRSLGGVRRELNEIEQGRRAALTDKHPAELARLTRSLNRLLDSERLQQTRYRDSLADLAHSLKTPLAVLQTVAEKIREQPGRNEQSRVLQDQIERMSQQIDYQLQRASLRRSGLVLHQARLAPVVAKLCEALSKVYQEKPVRVAFDISDDFQVPMEEGALLELLGNLLENAYRLSISHIRVRATARQGVCEITVEDDGPGVPESQRQRVIGRGERLDTAHPGQGIGLSVVRDIIESYDGELSLEDSALGGAAFHVRLPSERLAPGRRRT